MNDADHVQVSVEQFDDAMVFRPTGDIDLSRAPSLRVQLSQVQSERPKRLVVDLSEVPYMDSSGVATLVEAMQIARRHSCTLILCSMQEKVRSIFEIARLDMVFTIVDTADEALSVSV